MEEPMEASNNTSLDRSGGEMSTCLMEVSGGSFSGDTRMRYASIGQQQPHVKRSPQKSTSKWHSWTGTVKFHDNV